MKKDTHGEAMGKVTFVHRCTNSVSSPGQSVARVHRRRPCVRLLPIGNTLANGETPLNPRGAPPNFYPSGGCLSCIRAQMRTPTVGPHPTSISLSLRQLLLPMNAKEMLQTHPKSPAIDEDVLAECIDACFECTQTCIACADACLGEETVSDLIECIQTNLDCADTCDATGRILSRVGRSAPARIRSQVQACLEACQTCEGHCRNHADEHEHCQVCAEACRRCKEACKAVLEALDDLPSA